MRAQVWSKKTVAISLLVLRPTAVLSVMVCALLLAGCGQGEDTSTVFDQPAEQAPAAAPPVAPVTNAAPQQPATSAVGGVVVLGDSLAAVQGMEASQNWVGLLAAQSRVPVSNMSNLGESTSHASSVMGGLLSRFKPRVLVVAVGGDDGVNGLRLTEIEENLSRILLEAKAANVKVVLVATTLPQNYGADYRAGFDQIFTNLAQRHSVILVKDVLPNQPELLVKNTNTPTLAAQPLIFNKVAPAVQAALQ